MNRGRKKEWFDNDALWRDLYPFMFSPDRFSDAAIETKQAIKLAKPRGKAVLDLCCGPGRCAIPLAKRGFAVTGVDRTKFLLDKARSFAKRSHTRVEWIQADMRDFVRPGAFDLVLNLYTSFGYFDNKEQDVQVLRNMRENLKPGGKCVIEVAGKEFLARNLNTTRHELLLNSHKDTRLVRSEEVFDDWSRVRVEWILIRNGTAKTFRFHFTIYSGQELKDRLAIAGFRNVKLYGNFDGDEYGPATKRLIAVAETP
jgi:SAM-dependent methyltransferase